MSEVEPSSLTTASTVLSSPSSELALRVPPTPPSHPSRLELFQVILPDRTHQARGYSPGEKVGGRVLLVVGGPPPPPPPAINGLRHFDTSSPPLSNGGSAADSALGIKALWLDFNTVGEIRHRDKSERKQSSSSSIAPSSASSFRRRLSNSSSSSSSNPSSSSSSFSFYRHRVQLLGGDRDGVHSLARGRHEFPFMFVLPRSLPPSLTVRGGTRIYHRLAAVLDNPWGSEASPETVFKVDSDQDLNAIPGTLDPIDTSETKVLGSCSSLCGGGPLTVSVHVHKRGFAQGERIPVGVRVENALSSSSSTSSSSSSSEAVEVRIRVVQVAAIEDVGGKRSRAEKVETEVASNESLGVVEGGSRVEKTLELAVPFGSPASFDGKYKHIDVAYYLVTEGKQVKDKSFSFQLGRSEIVIGDIPHHSSARASARARRMSLTNGGDVIVADGEDDVDAEEEEVEFNIF